MISELEVIAHGLFHHFRDLLCRDNVHVEFGGRTVQLYLYGGNKRLYISVDSMVSIRHSGSSHYIYFELADPDWITRVEVYVREWISPTLKL